MKEITWRSLQKALSGLDENTVFEMLERERKAEHPRLSIVWRLHQRYTMLRMSRERAEIMKGIK